jgi:hypothetical protein
MKTLFPYNKVIACKNFCAVRSSNIAKTRPIGEKAAQRVLVYNLFMPHSLKSRRITGTDIALTFPLNRFANAERNKVAKR